MSNYILSIDPSLTSTGWAVLDINTEEVIDIGKICTTPKNDEDDRLMYILCTLLELRSKYDIKEIILENSYIGVNPKTGMLLSKLRGCLMTGFRLCNCSIEYMMPSEVRKHLLGDGNGNSDKLIVANEIINRYAFNPLVKKLGDFNDKPNKAKNSDIYDAIGIGLASIIKRKKALCNG